MQAGVGAVSQEQRRAAALHDAALIQHQDQLALRMCSTMGDDERGAPEQQDVERLLQAGFGDRVNRAGASSNTTMRGWPAWPRETDQLALAEG